MKYNYASYFAEEKFSTSLAKRDVMIICNASEKNFSSKFSEKTLQKKISFFSVEKLFAAKICEKIAKYVSENILSK